MVLDLLEANCIAIYKALFSVICILGDASHNERKIDENFEKYNLATKCATVQRFHISGDKFPNHLSFRMLSSRRDTCRIVISTSYGCMSLKANFSSNFLGIYFRPFNNIFIIILSIFESRMNQSHRHYAARKKLGKSGDHFQTGIIPRSEL